MRSQPAFRQALCLIALCGLAAMACTTGPGAVATVPEPPPVAGPPPVEAPAPDSLPGTGPPPAVPQFPATGERSGAEWTFRVIDAPNGTFGYDILGNGKLFVHQTNLPGLPGVEGCRTRDDAQRLASFVIGKIHKGQMPPSVTPAELDSLKIH
ncbi:MAG: DUF4907 domain-containing protein [Flavobacteriales bacterium]|nr:DUF4907 domain-containing protein [Flavobacteriales bacterium]